MTKSKIIAKIPCKLISKDLAVALKLEEPVFLALIPESLFHKLEITKEELILDMSVEGNKLLLETTIYGTI